jgi:hypothetical protein
MPLLKWTSESEKGDEETLMMSPGHLWELVVVSRNMYATDVKVLWCPESLMESAASEPLMECCIRARGCHLAFRAATPQSVTLSQ